MSLPKRTMRAGIFLVLFGFLLVFLGIITSAGESGATYGGLILIGPIPIVFGSSPDITSIMLLVGVVLAVIFFMSGRVR